MDDALADDAVKGIVITSGKDDFAGGMDLNAIAGMKDAGGAQGVFDGVMGLHALLRKIERAGRDPKTLKGGKPVAAAGHRHKRTVMASPRQIGRTLRLVGTLTRVGLARRI